MTRLAITFLPRAGRTAALVCAAISCGCSTASGVRVSVDPPAAQLLGGQSAAFTASVTGIANQGVTWSVKEGAAGGSVTSGGVYTAPSSTGLFHVVATSQADESKSGSAAATVTSSPISAAIRPQAAVLPPRGLQPFSCQVSGTADKACSWSVQEGAAGGTVSDSGLYTAPGSAGSYHVVAKSHDGAHTDTASVTVTSGPRSCPAGTGAGSIGVWTSITPPGIDLTTTAFGGNNFGMQEIVVDPLDPATVYLTTCYQGFWRSTDCGTTWTKMNTGANAAGVDGSRGWALDIDPVDTQTLYTAFGFGAGNLWQTTNGGVDWNKIIPPGVTDSINAFGGSDPDLYDIKVDPFDHHHLIAVFHSWFAGPAGHGNHDAGVLEGRYSPASKAWTFTIHNPPAGMGYAQLIFFLNDGNSWLLVGDDPSNGTWRTTDGGASFVKTNGSYHQHGGCQVYQSGDVYYSCGTPGVWRSTDAGASWTNVSSILPYTQGLVGDGRFIYAEQAVAGLFPPPFAAYNSTLYAPESPGDSGWALFGTQKLSNGAKRMAADRMHHIIYAAAWGSGVYRLVTEAQ